MAELSLKSNKPKTLQTGAKKQLKIVKTKSSSKLGGDKNSPKRSKNKVNSNKLELLITIVARPKAEFYVDLLHSFEVNMQMVLFGEGTANKEILDYLGIASEKAVIFSLIKKERLTEALDTLEEKFRTIKKGKGIAYTIPLTSVIGAAIYAFLSNNENAVKGDV